MKPSLGHITGLVAFKISFLSTSHAACICLPCATHTATHCSAGFSMPLIFRALQSFRTGVGNLSAITGRINCGIYRWQAANHNEFDAKILPLSHYEGRRFHTMTSHLK